MSRSARLVALAIVGSIGCKRASDKSTEGKPPMGSRLREWSIGLAVWDRLLVTPDRVVATVDVRRERFKFRLFPGVPAGSDADVGIVSVDRATGRIAWEVRGIPPLAALDETSVYAYGRTGVVVALDAAGKERWRTAVPDDRSAPGQARGDATSPFVPDLIVVGEAVFLAAGAEVLRLDPQDGRIVGRVSPCRGAGAVVDRLGHVASANVLLATCAVRSEYDDEVKPWADLAAETTPPTRSQLRISGGDVVGLDPDLRERWRDGFDDLRMDARNIADAGDGTAVLVLGTAVADRGVAVRLDAATGTAMWRQPVPPTDPVPAGDRLLFGTGISWTSDGSVRGLRDLPCSTRIPPIVRGGLVYVACGASIQEFELRTGRTRETPISEAKGSNLTVPPVVEDGFAYLGVAHLHSDDEFLGLVDNASSSRLIAVRLVDAP